MFSVTVFVAALAAVAVAFVALRLLPQGSGRAPVQGLVRCAAIAAVYVVLCLVLAPFSYGAVQVRVAEALCLLPVFGAEYIVGVTLGCFLANLFGSTILDVIFGTLATLLACLVTYRLRNVRIKGLAIPASLPPVLFNAVIVGIEITVFFTDFTAMSAPVWLLCLTNGISVGIGEIISCTVLGVALVRLIESNAALRRIFTQK
ncbi:QueT transporter family protein [uncultured Subdoligranulum sp.]|uniref:QueT transporter family protein n=1 Tax=uncultured Subdoligranulum sp. TaxID=512298 RepID=UPI002634EF75|nr:QueT transporter family protein [uncultured Subdoligranulum sp.]